MLIVPVHLRKVAPTQVFGRLTVVGEPFYVVFTTHRWQYAVFRCECGTYCAIYVHSVCKTSGKATQSCGCARRKIDLSDIRVYHVWADMKTRCANPKHKKFKDYGGRGIDVCGEWMEFPPFRDWARSSGYARGLELERVDNNGGYEPGNCRWATRKEQCRNTRKSRRITAFGETKTIPEWLEDKRCVLKCSNTIYYRVQNGWSAERALTTPPLIDRSNQWPRKTTGA